MVMLPDGLLTIELRAFYGCTALKSIYIPESVTHIENQAFYRSGLTDVTLHGNIHFIGAGSFSETEWYKNLSDDEKETLLQRQLVYLAGENYLSGGDYRLAEFTFSMLGNYRDSAKRLEEVRNTIKYNAALVLLENEQYTEALEAFVALGNFKDSIVMAEKANAAINQLNQAWFFENYNMIISNARTLTADIWQTVGIKTDGTVISTYDSSVGDWNDIVSVSINGRLIGLKSDGTVVTTANVDVSEFNNIVAVAAGGGFFLGLKTDGTVVSMRNGGTLYSNNSLNVGSWEGIIAIAAGSSHSVGLKSNGTVVAVGERNASQIEVDNWRNIIAIAAGSQHTIGLKSDGTVVALGNYHDTESRKKLELGDWTDIIAVDGGDNFTAGLKSDGTVVVTNSFNVSGWRDIVAISAGGGHLVGLRADGLVYAVGNNRDGQLNISSWRDINTIPYTD
jgi:hypothetical protein